MKFSINTSKLLVGSLLSVVILLGAVSTYAAEPSDAAKHRRDIVRNHLQNQQVKHHHKIPKGNFTSTTTQEVTDSGFKRSTEIVKESGEKATRNLVVENDKEAKTQTRTVTGTNFKGENFSGQTKVQKTDSGYLSESTRTNGNGETASRRVDATVDKEDGKLVQNITLTKPNGEVTTRTVERDLPNKKSESFKPE
jgi:hypothetical protein